MENQTHTRPKKPVPFVELMNHASGVKVSELSPESQERVLDSVENYIHDLSGRGKDRHRIFFVELWNTPEEIAPKVEIPDNRISLLENASALVSASEFLLARNIYSLLLKKNIADHDAILGLGICLLYLGDLVSAKKCFLNNWEDCKSEEALVWLGKCYLTSGDDEAALSYFKKVTQPEALPIRTRFEWYKDHGNALTRTGRLDEAAKKYLSALEIESDSPVVHINMGTLETQRDRYPEARRHFDIALELSPNNAKALCGLGILDRLNGEIEAAEAKFRKASDNEPTNLLSLYQLLEFAHSSGNYDDVKRRMQKFLNNSPDCPDMHYALATVCFQQGDWRECDYHLTEALKISPLHEKAAKLKGELVANHASK